MKIAFIAYGVLLGMLLVYSNTNGWVLTDTISSGKWGPKGHSAYHK